LLTKLKIDWHSRAVIVLDWKLFIW
jgi:hypothetical protein